MINVEEVFIDCRKLLGKDKSGYFSTDEFNRFSIIAEQMLWRFYVKHFEEHGIVADAMIPFNKLATMSLDGNKRFPLPSDFGRRGVLWWKKLTSVPGGEPLVERVKIQYLEKEELQDTLDSAVRGPSVDKKKMYYTFVGGRAQVFPEVAGPVEMDYLRNPIYANRAYSIDGDTDEEVYEPGDSVNYEWLENERPNIVNLIVMQYGIVLRESEVVQFAMAQHNEFQNVKQL